MTRKWLVSALVWHALEAGIQTYTGVAEIAWLQQILAFGWQCRPLGPTARFDCGIMGALAIEIAANTPELLKANGMWEERVSEPSLRIAQAA
jgi:acyl-homoserine lactone synthase